MSKWPSNDRGARGPDMKPTEKQIKPFLHPTSHLDTTCPADLQQDCSLPIAQLSPLVQAEARRFVLFTEKVLGRLNNIATGLCRSYIEELRVCPENYDQPAAYHVELLARRIGKEVDALYQGLRVSTIDHIGTWYEKRTLENRREGYKDTKSAC